MKNKLGVMQGRLLPKYQGRYQAFPIGYWADEFTLAKELGLDLIEFILDFNGADENPLLGESGRSEIRSLINETGVFVETVCADYFMEAPLHSENLDVAQSSKNVLERLIKSAIELQIKDIVIPCVDKSSLKSSDCKDRLVEVLSDLMPILQTVDLNLCLETDLRPDAFLSLLKRLPSNRITVNYDMGNSASLGFCVESEFEAYGARISDVHIKDRTLAGGSVLLGTGAVQFLEVFSLLKKIDYKGPYIMQAYRNEDGLEVFKQQLDYIKTFLYA